LKDYFVYIITNKNKSVLYTGVTNDLERRVAEHISGLVKGFASRYRLNRLLWFESTPNITAAISREKEIKGWLRSKKVALINSLNPEWTDLAADWFQDAIVRDSSLRSE
jgi:putative endonuclease